MLKSDNTDWKRSQLYSFIYHAVWMYDLHIDIVSLGVLEVRGRSIREERVARKIRRLIQNYQGQPR
jgi:hypothetical protein